MQNKYKYPYSLNLIFDLNLLINSGRLKEVFLEEGMEIDETLICCKNIDPHWEISSVKCSNCDRLLLNHPRPDLGRVRVDGVLGGTARVLFLDSRPLLSLKDKE